MAPRANRSHVASLLPPSTTTFAVTRANPYFSSPDGAPVSVIAYSFADDIGAIQSYGVVRATLCVAASVSMFARSVAVPEIRPAV